MVGNTEISNPKLSSFFVDGAYFYFSIEYRCQRGDERLERKKLIYKETETKHEVECVRLYVESIRGVIFFLGKVSVLPHVNEIAHGIPTDQKNREKCTTLHCGVNYTCTKSPWNYQIASRQQKECMFSGSASYTLLLRRLSFIFKYLKVFKNYTYLQVQYLFKSSNYFNCIL